VPTDALSATIRIEDAIRTDGGRWSGRDRIRTGDLYRVEVAL
jgi:hypothetical protein